jgi:predicted Rdx family selenoprotein
VRIRAFNSINVRAVGKQLPKPTLVNATSSHICTRLFRRWLLQAIPGTLVEHLNEIALHCDHGSQYSFHVEGVKIS